MPSTASRVRRVRSKTPPGKKRITKGKTRPTVKLKKAPSKKPARAAKPAPKKRAATSEKAPAFAPLKFPAGVLLGAHTSTAGGLATAIDRALTCGFTAAQLFVKNNKQWFAPALPDEEAKAFRAARKESGVMFFAHNSYLINLGSFDPQMFATSVKAMVAELERAEALDLPFIVMHPGSHGGHGEEAGLARIVEGIDRVIAATAGYRCKVALEITAGQGNALGYRLEHLTYLIENMRDETRAGICLDTAHLFAAGYNIHTREGYEALVAAVDQQLGSRRVLGLHLNDSKVPFASRVDRHHHLGEGHIGLDTFRWIVQDPRWARTPKVLETPKGEDMREDVVNLSKLASYLQ
jgi:deoxyribonuclease-4